MLGFTETNRPLCYLGTEYSVCSIHAGNTQATELACNSLPASGCKSAATPKPGAAFNSGDGHQIHALLPDSSSKHAEVCARSPVRLLPHAPPELLQCVKSLGIP